MPLRIIPDDTTIKFMWLRRFTFPAALILSVLSVILFVFVGPNYGIDFRGGTMMVLQPPGAVVTTEDIAEVRSRLAVLDLGDVDVQTLSELGGEQSISIRIELTEGDEVDQSQVVDLVHTALSDMGEFRSEEFVGPRVSGELARDGIIAAVIAMLSIMIYVWFRFEWQFAVGAIAALLHDVLLTLGFFALVKLDFNLSSIAAILTIVGYSLNDTVVVYDRIRETLRKYKKASVSELLDRAINGTLARTTITSLTTWVVLWSLFVFGGDVIRSFVAAMIFGVAIGTYSSIFIAAPVLIFMRLRSEQMQPVIDKTDAGSGATKPASD